MTEERRLDGVVITADNRAIAPELYDRLTLVRVEESVQLPDYFAVHFDDPHFEVFDRQTFVVGTVLQIAFRAEGDPVVVTTGEITAISVEPGRAGRHELVLSGLDLTHRLARVPRSRSFQRLSDADIASRIASEYGLDADVDSTGDAHPYLLQTAETDYAFLRRRAARIGFDFWIAERTFHFKKDPRALGSPPALRWGENLLHFSVRLASAEHCDEVQVRGWDALGKRAITGRATDGDAGTDAPAAADAASATRRAFGRVQRSAGHLPVRDQAEADALAGSFMLRASGSEVVLRGEATGNPQIAAGAQLQVDQIGSKLSGKYRVTNVDHIFGAGKPYVTRFVCGGKDPAGLADLVGRTVARGNGDWGGLVVGIVTNNDDPDKLGRVKVKFPTLSQDDESTWARLVTPGGGPKRGMQWLPEVDDEVMVGFELDDSTRPVVLGGMWNRGDAPPMPDAGSGGEVTTRLFASRKDSRLVFTDESTPSVELSLGGGACVLHLAQKETSLKGDQKLVISADQIEITANQKLTLGGAEVEINSTGTMTVSGKPINLN